jgi:hypothetical protein
MFIEHNNPNDQVQAFCKKNNIEFSWDWNPKNGSWNEIIIDKELLFQISQGITLVQFLNVIKTLSKNFYANNFEDDGVEFMVCMPQDEKHELLFNKFLEKHYNTFKQYL